MAERLISPGVFTRERDLTFLPQGIAEIGAAFIGPTLKGPAFRPVIVNSQEEFEATFGGTSPDFYTPYAVQNYLREASRATVCRVLGLDGYDSTTTRSLILNLNSGSVSVPVAVLFPTRRGVTLPTGSVGATAASSFALSISGSNGLQTFNSMSVDPTSPNYFAKVLGTTAASTRDGYALYQFPNALRFVSGNLANATVTLQQVTGELNFSGSIFGTYREASTPWIRSQTIGSVKYNLFKFHTLSDGNAANTDVKVSIASIRPNPNGTGYGTFSVLIRRGDDTDSKLEILEQFDNLTLDPTSPNYVAARIGTARTIIDANNDIYLEGDWPNKSRYVYLELDSGIEDVPADALPYGFGPLAAPINAATVPAPNYVTTRYNSPAGGSSPVANNRVFYGFNFQSETGRSYLAPLPSGSIDAAGTVLRVGTFAVGSDEKPAGGLDDGFDLLTWLKPSDLIDIAPQAAVNIRKFTVPFQNGFDGQAFNVVRAIGGLITPTNTQGFDLSDSTRDGARAYKICLDALANPDAFDINLLVIPGVIYSQHPFIVTQAINMCEARGDCFYILDGSTLGATVIAAATDVQDIDSNYAGTYHPWIKIRDAGSNKNIWAPPSVVIPNVYAFNDRNAAEWFAPAGLNRGNIDVALEVRTRLDQSNRDILYEARVNPIATFPGQGIVAWGQKTLQQQASSLDRINVRRLLIAVKKFIASTSRFLVFEQNVESTRQRFLSIVNPYLQSVQERSGLFAFRVVMDETNNTPDIIDRNVLVGQLYLQPSRTAEFISLEFNILPTGAVFGS